MASGSRSFATRNDCKHTKQSKTKQNTREQWETEGGAGPVDSIHGARKKDHSESLLVFSLVVVARWQLRNIEVM